MNKEQINRKEMHDSTLLFLDLHSEKWSPIPKVGEIKNELVRVNNDIEGIAKEQSDSQIFLGKNKTQLKNSIATKADILNDTLEVFATFAGNNALVQQMGDSAHALGRLRTEDFIRRVQLIVGKAKENMDALQNEYGVTEQQITDLQNDIDSFLDLNGMPRAYRVASVVATQDLKELFSEANNVLENKLDKIMKIFKNRDSSFYKGYLAARSVINN